MTAQVVGQRFDLGQLGHAFQARTDSPGGSAGRSSACLSH
jgi:hypothetical protein